MNEDDLLNEAFQFAEFGLDSMARCFLCAKWGNDVKRNAHFADALVWRSRARSSLKAAEEIICRSPTPTKLLKLRKVRKAGAL